MNRKTLIAFAGGGTGGHVYPILAMIEYARKQEDLKNIDLLYYGSLGKIEEKVCRDNQIPFANIPHIGGMPRNWKIIFWFLKFLNSFFKTFIQLIQNKPDCIFSTGGYSSGPVIFSAWILGIPYIIHNLDAVMGLANKTFGKKAAAVSYGMKPHGEIIRPLNGPVLLAGNPLREEFYKKQIDKNLIYEKFGFDPKRKTLLIMGGSQGAQVLNEVAFSVVDDLLADNWQIVHQLGELQYQKFEEAFPDTPFYYPLKFIHNILEVYSIADLAVCRSGAMSISELEQMKIPAVLVPLPTSAQNHQFLNAQMVEEKGMGLLLDQKKLTAERLLESIEKIYSRKSLIALNFDTQEKPNPCEILWNTIKKLFFDITQKESNNKR